MNYAFTNGKILDGTKDMQVQTGLCILVQDGTITDIVPDTAELAGISDITGSIEKGKAADLIVTAKNPLNDLRALRNIDMVVARGTIIDHPKIKKKKQVETELDKFL